jgi:paraquat-inducible protein B
MSKQANKTVIGIFVVGAVALAIATVLIVGSGKFFRQTIRAVCYFDGSVGGLNIGAPVVFRGVKVGSVVDILLRFDREGLIFKIPVYIEIDPNKIVSTGPEPGKLGENVKLLIDKGLRAQLEMQSFVTGQMQVGLDFHPDKPANFTKSTFDAETTEIPTIPTPFQALMGKVEKIPIDQIIKDFQSTLQGIEKIANSPEIEKSLQSISQAATEAKGLMQTVSAKVGPTFSKIDGAVADVQTLVRNVDDKVGPLATTIDDTAKDARKLMGTVNQEIRPISAGAQETLKEAQRLLRDIDGKVTTLSSSLAGTIQDAQKFIQKADKQVEPLGPAIKDVQKLVQNIDKQVEPLGLTIQDARKLIANANQEIQPISASLQGTLKEAQKLLRDVDGKAAVLTSSLDEAMKDVQKLVRNMDGRVDQLAPAIEKTLETAGATLQEAQGTLRSIGGSTGESSPLIYELTQTLKELSTAARSLRALADYLDRHPESLIRGKK